MILENLFFVIFTTTTKSNTIHKNFQYIFFLLGFGLAKAINNYLNNLRLKIIAVCEGNLYPQMLIN